MKNLMCFPVKMQENTKSFDYPINLKCIWTGKYTSYTVESLKNLEEIVKVFVKSISEKLPFNLMGQKLYAQLMCSNTCSWCLFLSVLAEAFKPVYMKLYYDKDSDP